MVVCPEDYSMVDERISRVLTQYRESPKLLHLLKTYLRQVEIVSQTICDLPDKFKLDHCNGEQLTYVGKRLGWPRCHCVCDTQPFFGFDCGEFVFNQPVAGFCEEGVTWSDCNDNGYGDICILDDDLYRRFLKVRVYQVERRYDLNSLNEALKVMWGDTATTLGTTQGVVVVTPGRDLTDEELSVLQLYPRVLPIAPGIEVRFHFGKQRVFGFGEGWGEFCNQGVTENLPIETDAEVDILADNTDVLIIDTFEQSAPWMCQVDVKPYDC